MNFWTADNLGRIGGGRWIGKPAAAVELRGVGTDTRGDLAGRAFVALCGERHDGHDHLEDAVRAGAAMLVVDREVIPPVDVPVLRVDEARSFLKSLAREYRDGLSGVRVVAITGSAGKTTTKDLVHHVLRQSLNGTCAPKSFNNEIGVPLTILAARPGDDYVVVEIGTNAPGEISMLASIARPDVAVITSIGRAHLEGLGGVEGVLREKASLLEHLAPDGIAILPADAPGLRRFAPDGRTLWFGETGNADLRMTERGREGHASWFVCDGVRYETRLPGRHNAMNALAAIAVAQGLSVDDASIQAALSTAEPPAMRMTIVEAGGVTYFNDAYNANPDSMIASLEAFAETSADARRRVLILGDMLELGDESAMLHEELGRFIARFVKRRPIARLLAVGVHGGDLVRGVGDAVPVVECAAALDEGVIRSVLRCLAPGDAVLVKGSRRIGLERLIERAAAGTPAPHPQAVSQPAHAP